MTCTSQSRGDIEQSLVRFKNSTPKMHSLDSETSILPRRISAVTDDAVQAVVVYRVCGWSGGLGACVWIGEGSPSINVGMSFESLEDLRGI